LPPQTYIPDDNFEAYLEANNMGNGIANDDSVTTSNIVGITFLNISSKAISDLTGIEDFTSLTDLLCYSNQLTNLDVSQNTSLTHLYCNSNQLTNLDVSQNTGLTDLLCFSNQLTSLGVSQNTSLINLQCNSNQITNLDMSQNTALTTLNFYSNQLASIDITQNIALTNLNTSNNQLTSLQLSNNTALTSLYAAGNQLTNLDVSQNTSLTNLQCNSNQITNLDISQNTSLTDLNCSSNQLTSLDLRNGNNQNLLNIYLFANTTLTCIHVDDVTYSTNNWTNIDTQHYFSTNCSAPNSVQEIPSSISIYPNPTSQVITISIENFNGNIQTEVYDLLGNRLQKTNETTISLQDYARGIYLLKVAYEDKLQEVKVIKQ
jgi:Leucine-rich repeat (LRR) protein